MEQRKRKSRYSKKKFLLTFIVVMGVFAAIRHVFDINIPMRTDSSLFAENKSANDDSSIYIADSIYQKASLPEEEQEEGELSYPSDSTERTRGVRLAEPEGYDNDDEPDEEEEENEEQSDTIEQNEFLPNEQTAKTDGRKKFHPIRGVWNYSKCFPDVQDVQIIAARKHGINPVRSREEAEQYVKNHQLVNVTHSPYYTVDKLTHSIPYLVPRAQHLLNTISVNFIDSCIVKGLPVHLLMVTSVLRTADDITKLQRGNQNATTNSCHCYGTTVDIAYNRFVPVNGTYYRNMALLRWNEPMKKVLSEVLRDLREQGLCYVKYERKQGCFHLTCR